MPGAIYYMLLKCLTCRQNNILTLVVQTKATVCATIFFSRSEVRSKGVLDHIGVRINKQTDFTPLFESV